MKILKTAFTLISVFAVTTLSLPGFSFAEIPRIINYQGKLTTPSGTPVPDGTYSVTFRVYDQEAGGDPLWYETQSITIQKGIFSTQIGATKDLNLSFDRPYYLGIKIGSDAEMSPRQRLSSAAYAFKAANAAEAAHAISADTLTDPTKLLPSGVIVIWSGSIADIPDGWLLCDGTNGTPDLRDRFIVGAYQDDNGIPKTNIEGTLRQQGGNVVVNANYAGRDWPGGDGNFAAGGGRPRYSVNTLSPYYALAFIMKE